MSRSSVWSWLTLPTGDILDSNASIWAMFLIRTNVIDKYRTETCCVIGNYYSLRYHYLPCSSVQVTEILISDLSMRKQWFTSSGRWSWTLAISLPSHWWVTSTWRWRILMRRFSHTGKNIQNQWTVKVTIKQQASNWSEQTRLSSMVWAGADLWDTQDAILLPLLLQTGKAFIQDSFIWCPNNPRLKSWGRVTVECL